MKKIILAMAAIATLASCSTTDEATTLVTDSEVRITSSIATRTTGNTWECADEIGVYMTTNGGGSFADLGKNILYTNSAADSTTATFSSTTPLYYPATDKVDLLAYYPHSTGTTDAGLYTVDVATQGDQGAIDLMVANVDDQAKTTSAVDMTFSHKLSRIALTISADGGLVADDLEDMVVTLSGTKAEASFDLTSDDIDFDDAVASDIKMLTAQAGTSSEAIVIPQDDLSATLTFATTDGNIFTTDIPTTAFVAGLEYIYTVTIMNTVVSISSTTINEWGEGNGDGDALTAEPAAVDIALVTVDDDEVYQIYSAEGLQAFASIVNNSDTDISGVTTEGIDGTSITQNKSANGLLMNDIDLKDVCGATLDSGNGINWTPIGSSTYSGDFDGNGKVVSGLYINNSSSSQGLFGSTSGATIKNLGVSGSVTGGSYTGGIVGTASLYVNNGNYTATIITGCYFSGSVSGTYYIGGIVGQVNSDITTIAACYFSGSVSGTSSTGGIGGIVGYSVGTITSCYSYGSVSSAASSTTLGGVVGYNDMGTVSYCYYDISKVSESYTGQQNNTPTTVIGSSSYPDATNSGGLTTEMMTKTASTDYSLLYYLSQSGYYSGYWISSLFSSINNGYPIFSWQL